MKTKIVMGLFGLTLLSAANAFCADLVIGSRISDRLPFYGIDAVRILSQSVGQGGSALGSSATLEISGTVEGALCGATELAFEKVANVAESKFPFLTRASVYARAIERSESLSMGDVGCGGSESKSFTSVIHIDVSAWKSGTSLGEAVWSFDFKSPRMPTMHNPAQEELVGRLDIRFSVAKGWSAQLAPLR